MYRCTAGLSYDADGNQKTNPGNSAVGVAVVTASTVNLADDVNGCSFPALPNSQFPQPTGATNAHKRDTDNTQHNRRCANGACWVHSAAVLVTFVGARFKRSGRLRRGNLVSIPETHER